MCSSWLVYCMYIIPWINFYNQSKCLEDVHFCFTNILIDHGHEFSSDLYSWCIFLSNHMSSTSHYLVVSNDSDFPVDASWDGFSFTVSSQFTPRNLMCDHPFWLNDIKHFFFNIVTIPKFYSYIKLKNYSLKYADFQKRINQKTKL